MADIKPARSAGNGEPLAGVRLRNGVRLFERPHQLARFLAEQALCKLHRLPLELVSTAFDQLDQLADSRIVVEAIAPLSGPLGDDGES